MARRSERVRQVVVATASKTGGREAADGGKETGGETGQLRGRELADLVTSGRLMYPRRNAAKQVPNMRWHAGEMGSRANNRGR